MNKLQVANEAHFKTAAKKAIFSLVFFAFSYLILFILSIGLVVLCGIGGIALMSFNISAITIGFGLGLIGLGVIVFIFLIKFIFKKHAIDRSHLVELEESDAPLLYKEIRNIVEQVQTSFPNKIYLSHDVNAAVFYDSTFLSMFLPIKKNLQIGLGLINSVTKEELKAILAHEFGHFSQKSMKVGSYVYTVNQIIFNMLYDNEDYGRRVQGLGQIGYFAIFAFTGLKIVEGIQWLLKKLYGVVNISHLGLSREMEFHADAIAANTIGAKVFINSLLRLDLAHNAHEQVLNYYDQKIGENIKPLNIYPQQFFAMNLLAIEASIEIVNDLPNVAIENLSRYNKSKLVIKNQWASHPSTEDRIAAIKKYNFKDGEDNGLPAKDFFIDIENLQCMVTEVLYAKVVYNGKSEPDDFDQFKEGFARGRKTVSFPKLFNGYYDYHNPVKVDLDNSTITGGSLVFDDLFSADKVDMIYTVSSIQNDISLLKQIQNGTLAVSSFEYDGVKSNLSDTYQLIQNLEVELDQLQAKIVVHDLTVYEYFKQLAAKNNRSEPLRDKYQVYIDFDRLYDSAFELYNKAVNETQFIQVTTPFEKIKTNLDIFSRTEKKLKTCIGELLLLKELKINNDQLDVLNKYLTNELAYFIHSVYKDDILDILFNALHTFKEVLNKNYLLIKMSWLEEMESLQQIDVRSDKSDVNIIAH